VDAREMETAAAFWCSMGFAKVAPKSRRICVRSGRLALMFQDLRQQESHKNGGFMGLECRFIRALPA
jgi:hypothetical protein